VYKNPTNKGRFEISQYDSKWRIEEAITKRISMVVGECNNLGNYSFEMRVAVISTLSIIGVKAWNSR
jgi:hypothetical protein